MAHPLIPTSASKATIFSPPPTPSRRASVWYPRELVPEPSHSEGMERIIDRCTSPTPYSHPSARPSDLLFLRISAAVSGNLRLQSNSSTTLSCATQSSVSATKKPLMRILRKIASCISLRHHDDLNVVSSHKKINSVVSSCYVDFPLDDEMDEKSSGEYEHVHLVPLRSERLPPALLTRLDTIEERDEECF